MSHTADATLVDQDVRDCLSTELDRTFFVEAGAGTGKTTTIVKRIVRLVATGRVAMEHLVAITFTEAAAAELRDRVREGLEKAALNESLPQLERDRCAVAARDVDLAAISTIHAFAISILRTYPLEAGLPPGFRVLDEIEQEQSFQDRFRAWYWGAADDPVASSTLRRVLLLGLSHERIRELAAALEQQYDLLTPETSWPAPMPADALAVARQVGQDLLALEAWTTAALDGSADRLVQHVASLQVGARRLLAADAEASALAALQSLPDIKTTIGAQTRWTNLPGGQNGCAAIKAILRAARKQVTATLADHRTAAFADLLALLRDFALQGARERKAQGTATYADQLAWTRDLLRDNLAVRRRAQQQYHRVFLDEFQDTDPLQAEIAFYLASEGTAPRWQELPLVEGKLFVVGDPKQSIYRFRRADISLYDALLSRLEGAGAALSQNFRSLQPVLTWVNHFFGQEMRHEAGVQPLYVPLAHRWEMFAEGCACGVYRIGRQEPLSAGQVAAREAEVLARIACTAIHEGWRVTDADAPGDTRAARWSDVAILLPRTTHLRTLERALERRGVPYRLESGTLLLDTQEVRDLLSCLRAIEDPSDQVALVAALRSPAYGCSDVEIQQWVDGGGRLDYDAPESGPAGPIQTAFHSLAHFRSLRLSLSPAALAEAFVADRLLVASAFLQPRPREAWRRLRYVVSRARAFTSTGRHSLRAFLDWIESLSRANVRDAESAEIEADDDAVRIQTVHRSKGLEYPIVLLADLGGSSAGRSSTVQLYAERLTGTLACCAGKEWKTPDFDAARQREAQMERAESVRLLYVATTRARDHLVLSLYRGSRGADSHAARIETSFEDFDGSCHALDESQLQASAARSAESAWPDLMPVDEAAWVARRADLLARLSEAPVTSAIPADDFWGDE